MRAKRALLILTACWSAFAVVGAVPGGAVISQDCQLANGSLAASPGLTDAPTDQTITLAMRLSGCSRTGGSGLIVATTTASQATCATLTAALRPTTATVVWANRTTSTVSVTFSPVQGAQNRLILTGRVDSGTERDDRIDGGLHLSDKFIRIIRHVTQRHHPVRDPTVVRQHRPLNSGGDCTVAHPVAWIGLRSYQSLKFWATPAGSATSTTKSPSATGRLTPSGRRTSGAASSSVAGVRSRSAPAARLRAAHKRSALRRAALRRSVALSNVRGSGASSSNSFLEPTTVVFAIFLGACLVLFVLLFNPKVTRFFRDASSPRR